MKINNVFVFEKIKTYIIINNFSATMSIKNILNDAERTEEVDGDMLCSINELVDEILSIYCLEKQQRKMAIAEENEILSEEAKKAGWKSGVMNI